MACCKDICMRSYVIIAMEKHLVFLIRVLGELRRYLTKESSENQKLRELISLLIYWINEELGDQRIVVRNLQEDLYDGQILQKLIEKLAGIRSYHELSVKCYVECVYVNIQNFNISQIEVPEVTQSEEGQKKKLDLVVLTVNRIVSPTEQPRWDAELIHSKILVSMVVHFRAPIRLPEHVSVKMLVVSKHQGHSRSEFITELLTTTQGELGLKVTDLESQFQDGVFLVLLMGLLEGYFVPLHAFHLQVCISFLTKGILIALVNTPGASLPINSDVMITYRFELMPVNTKILPIVRGTTLVHLRISSRALANKHLMMFFIFLSAL
ncbi:hypothetical protein DICVIV_08519 [Dictyocaulus viviparus]|uniref:Calponin-homology (CH) domain-containing protein n=1 Tax=Dictyocaulus viviparus TaxID=29172 RepID=A0A0D8XLM7_DICVI|nr:hypothetical protein DICVIV_08519 [Dictyocaulus viviparus]